VSPPRDGSRPRPRRAAPRRLLGGRVGLALAVVLVGVSAACRHQAEERAAPARIVFFGARDGEYALYAVGSDGRGLTRVAAASPSLASETLMLPSPRYDKLIVPNGEGKLRILDAGGFHDLADYAEDAAWSPDGKRIAFAGPGPGLWVVDADGGNRRPLTRNEGDDDPAWSPDGEQLAFARNGVGILVIDAEGGDRRVVSRSRRVLDQVQWASAEAISFREEREFSAGDLVTVAVPSGRVVRRVPNSGWGFSDPIVSSPDGRRIAFTSTGNDRSSIIVMNTDGSGRHRVTPRDEYASQPAWSPDGRVLAYIRQDDLGRRELVAVRPDGTGRRTLTRAYPNGPDPLFAAWMRASVPSSPSRYAVSASERADGAVLQTTYPVAAMTARSGRVALVSPQRAYTPLHYWLTPPLLLWDATRGTTTRLSLGICGQPESVALAQERFAYDCPYDSHAGQAGALAVSPDPVARPFIAAEGYVGDGQQKPAALPGRVAAGDRLLVFNDRLYAPFGRFTARRLWRVEGRRKVLVARGADAAAPAAVGRGLIVVERDDGRVTVVRANGRVVARFPAGERPPRDPLLRDAPPSAALTDGHVVVLRADRLTVHPLALPATRPSRPRSWQVGDGARLAGAARGLVAYVVGTTVYVLRLSDGRRITIRTRSRARVPAALTSAGLFYAVHARPVPAREQPPFHANWARIFFRRHDALLRRLA
jgi:dipeptidyl aminopeptidase/acylaminoacyl peptidase